MKTRNEKHVESGKKSINNNIYRTVNQNNVKSFLNHVHVHERNVEYEYDQVKNL